MLGTIDLEESVSATDTFTLGPLENRLTYGGKRTVTIKVRDGKYDAEITTDYTLTVSRQHTSTPENWPALRHHHHPHRTASGNHDGRRIGPDQGHNLFCRYAAASN